MDEVEIQYKTHLSELKQQITKYKDKIKNMEIEFEKHVEGTENFLLSTLLINFSFLSSSCYFSLVQCSMLCFSYSFDALYNQMSFILNHLPTELLQTHYHSIVKMKICFDCLDRLEIKIMTRLSFSLSRVNVVLVLLYERMHHVIL